MMFTNNDLIINHLNAKAQQYDKLEGFSSTLPIIKTAVNIIENVLKPTSIIKYLNKSEDLALKVTQFDEDLKQAGSNFADKRDALKGFAKQLKPGQNNQDNKNPTSEEQEEVPEYLLSFVDAEGKVDLSKANNDTEKAKLYKRVA